MGREVTVYASATDPYLHVLARPVDERDIRDLHSAGLLNATARDRALERLAGGQHWWRWANRMLLAVGSALFLAGIVFFFAYNWKQMSAIAKFGSIEAGLWACAMAAWYTGLERTVGKVLLLAASVLVGVLLAVYGQVYQTGADAFENYVLWAVLILPWVMIGRFAPLWVLWLAIANVALSLFWFQVEAPPDFELKYELFLLLAALNGVALIAREYFERRGWPWLAVPWIRPLLWLSVLTYLMTPTLSFILETSWQDASLLMGTVAMAAALAVGYWYFRHHTPDLLAVAMIVVAVCVIFLTIVGRLIFEASDDAPAFLAFGFVVLATSCAAALYLRSIRKGLPNESLH